MAYYSMLRRASSSALAPLIRFVRSSRTFHGAAFTVLSTEKRNLSRELTRRSRLPILQFSTETLAANRSDEEILISILESEIEDVDSKDTVCEIPPDEFPFEIQDNRGERTILLTREYQDEIIKVEVDIPNKSAEEEADENSENEGGGYESRIPLVVSVSKDSGGLQLEFGVTAYPDEISIDHLSIKQPDGAGVDLAYEGPEFSDLDENLQKAFLKYLEVRGINPITASILDEYMIKKDSREYLEWLKNLKEFIEH